MTTSSGPEMKDSNALTIHSQRADAIHTQRSEKRKTDYVTCNEKLTGQKTLCECCAGCCSSPDCRAGDHLLAKELKRRQAQVATLRQTGMSAEEAGKLVYNANSPRHLTKRARQGEQNETLEKTKSKTKTTETKDKNDTKRNEKKSVSEVEQKKEKSKVENERDNKNHEAAEKKSDMQHTARLEERVNELEKLCRKLQAEIEVLQKSRHEKQIIREPVKIVTDETKQHEKRLQEIEKQVKNLNISSHKESAADTAFRLKFKRIIEKNLVYKRENRLQRFEHETEAKDKPCF